MAKYYVTYSVMDGDAGANPFWHASLVFSTQDDDAPRVRVRDAYGLYSLPSTTTNPWIKKIKELLGFNINLQDSQGTVLQEKMRDLDGAGLHGISFEISEEQYALLQSLIQRDIELEKQTTAEIELNLRALGMEPDAANRYAAELELAAIEGREPRYKLFHIAIELTRKGVDTTHSHACKNYALNLLREAGIIDAAQHQEITGDSASYSFPRFGHELSPIRLVSTGTPKEHLSARSGKIFYNREWGNNQLFWATPPTTLQSLEIEEEKRKADDLYQKVNRILTRVHDMEIALLRALHPLKDNADEAYRSEQLKFYVRSMQSLYVLFSNASENDQDDILANRLLQAEYLLNAAQFTLTPELLDSTFILRACQSIPFWSVVGCLTVCITMASVGVFLTPIGLACTAVATIVGGYQSYGFFAAESSHQQKLADYNAMEAEASTTELLQPDDQTFEEELPRLTTS